MNVMSAEVEQPDDRVLTDTIPPGDMAVVFTKGWCLLDDISDDDECLVLVLRMNVCVRFSTFPVKKFPSPAQ